METPKPRVCPHCDLHVPDETAAECPRCSMSLEHATYLAAIKELSQPQVCPNCGHHDHRDLKECPRCQMSMELDSTEKEPSQSAKDEADKIADAIADRFTHRHGGPMQGIVCVPPAELQHHISEAVATALAAHITRAEKAEDEKAKWMEGCIDQRQRAEKVEKERDAIRAELNVCEQMRHSANHAAALDIQERNEIMALRAEVERLKARPYFSDNDVETLREVLKDGHEHYDGMNECATCDQPLLQAATDKITKLQTELDRLRSQAAYAHICINHNDTERTALKTLCPVCIQTELDEAVRLLRSQISPTSKEAKEVHDFLSRHAARQGGGK